MRIALGQRIKDGPWGGGNRFCAALAEALQRCGDDVVFDLKSSYIDLILLVDPRSRNPEVAFTPKQIHSYVARHPQTIVVHRINECDERKGTRTMNARLRLANTLADHTVFIASWLKDLNVWQRKSGCDVILNGADTRIFHHEGRQNWDQLSPLRLATHHWGGHAFKGHDVYAKIDAMLDEPEWNGRLEFTYIGNLPRGHEFRHARFLPPLNGEALAAALRQHHVYLTASINEPAGMHHIEGALCGLPLLYRNSGALPEYCQGFGEAFQGVEDVDHALRRMVANYQSHLLAMAYYDHTADRMCQEYLSLFDRLLKNRAALLERRQARKSLLEKLLIRLPL